MARGLAIYGMGLALLSFLAAGPANPQTDPQPKVTIGRVPEGSKMVDAKIDSNGVIHLLFQRNEMPFYATSTDNGKTTGAVIPVVKSKTTVPGLNYVGWNMAVDEKGKVFVVMGNNAWKVKETPADQKGLFLATLEPGAKEFGPLKALNGVPSEGFSIAAGKEGSVTAAYLCGKLFWEHSSDAGKTFTQGAEVNKNYLPCPCCTTSLAVGKDGTLALLYRESTENRRDIFVVLSKDGKETRFPVSRTLWEINGCPMTYFRIAPAGDGFVAAWPTKGQAYFARIGSDGKLWAPGEVKVGGNTFMRSSVFALAGNDDTTLVGWKSDEKLHWKIFDAKGKQVGSEGDAPGAGPQAGGVVDKDGGYILFP